MTVKQFVSLGALLTVTIIGAAGCNTAGPADELTAEQHLSRQLETMRIAQHRGGSTGAAHDR